MELLKLFSFVIAVFVFINSFSHIFLPFISCSISSSESSISSVLFHPSLCVSVQSLSIVSSLVWSVIGMSVVVRIPEYLSIVRVPGYVS